MTSLDKAGCLQRFDAALSALAYAFPQLEDCLPKPSLRLTVQGWVPRYNPPLIEHAILMKFGRMISILAAMRALVAEDFIQEQGILQRASDEAGDDITFLAFGRQNEITPLHEEFLELFWREEFESGNTPSTHLQRKMIPRKKIRRYLSGLLGANREQDSDVNRMLYGVFSGFTHGASTQIFELIRRDTFRFSLFGVHHDEHAQGYFQNALNYPLRTLMSGVIVARSLGSAEVDESLNNLVATHEQWNQSLI